MQRAMLLMNLALAIFCNTAVAATPVFQLNAPDAGAQHLLAIDAYPSKVERADPNKAMPAALTPRPVSAAPIVPVALGAMGEESGVNKIPVTFSRNSDDGRAAAEVSPSLNNSDDLLFYFLKDFEAQPRQKPGRWALLLVGLCFVLYQVRRRPMRTSIGFFSVPKHAGQFSA